MVRNPEHTAIYSLAKMNDTLLLGTYSSHGLKYLSPKGIENRDLPSEGQTVNITQISVLCRRTTHSGSEPAAGAFTAIAGRGNWTATHRIWTMPFRATASR